MSSIFTISKELESILNDIEENDGEVTPELEAELEIATDSFNDKLESYCDVINKTNNDISFLDSEIERLKHLKQTKKNIIDNLKRIITMFLLKHGDKTKSGNSTISLSRYKLSTRKTQTVDVNNDIIKDISKYVLQKIYLYNYNNLVGQEELNETTIIDYINNKLTDVISTEDLKTITIDFNTNIKLSDLLNNEVGIKVLETLLKYDQNIEIKPNVNKTSIKELAKEEKQIPSFTKINNNTTLTIK